MFCVNCGAQIPDGARFCTACGAKIEANIPPQTPQNQTPPVVQQPQAPQMQTPPVVQQPQAPQLQTPPVVQQPQTPQMQTPPVEQKETFYVKRLPIIMIVVLTIGLFFGSAGAGNMSIAAAVSCVPGIVLIFLIYKLDKIEAEPVGLLVKLFLFGGLLLPVIAIIAEMAIGAVISLITYEGSLLYCFLEAFVVAACTEELCKYAVLKKLTWKHPAFNYRFDGVVYSTTVAIGFEVVENLLYLIGSTADTAYVRAAFPGHCIFGIYMGYYYGQAKTLELNGDITGSSKMRKKGIITAIIIHGFYDFICFVGQYTEYELIQVVTGLGLVVVMVVLNVTAYKNIKRFAYDDRPV